MKAPILNPPTGRSFHCVAEGYTGLSKLSRRSHQRKTRRRRHDSRRNGAPQRLFQENFSIFSAITASFKIQRLNKYSKWTPGCLFCTFFALVSQVSLVSVSKHLDLDHLFRYEKGEGRGLVGEKTVPEWLQCCFHCPTLIQKINK